MLLRNIDLNLLVVLDALLTEKHVTRTGVRLHLSQPAISHSLSKLRVLLDDPILIRQGSEVVLSALAQNLQAPLKEILSQIEILLGKSIDFVPANSHRTFRLAMSDYGAAIVLPKLLRQLRAEAPNTTLVVTQDSRHGMLEQIAAYYGADLDGLWFVGDSRGDLDAALAVHCQPVLVKTGKGLRTLAKGLPERTLVFDDLAAVADHLLD